MKVSLGNLAFWVLAAFAGSDALLRQAPPSAFSFRAWETLRVHPAPGGAFEANARYRNPRSYGDLANLANRPDLRVFRREDFTTDAYGFRNDPGLSDGRPIDALLLGDSFAAGSGLSDDQALAERLTTISGKTVYCAAGLDPTIDLVKGLRNRLHLHRGLIIHVFIERASPPIPGPLPENASFGSPRWLRTAYLDLQDRWRYSPVGILARREYRRALDDRWLPNDGRAVVTLRQLRRVGPMLFFSEEDSAISQPRDASTYVNSWLQLEAAFKNEGLNLLVVLVPAKYSVYAGLLDPPVSRSVEPPFLQRVASGLHDNGVAAIDLTVPMQEAAQRAQARGETIYWADDTHWNAAGVDVAAASIVRWWEAQPKGLGSAGAR